MKNIPERKIAFQIYDKRNDSLINFDLNSLIQKKVIISFFYVLDDTV